MRQSELAYEVGDGQRRAAMSVQIGTVEDADYVAARVRIRIGDRVTGWLRWLTQRAGEDRSWWAPDLGEQVGVLCPSGDTRQGLVLPGLYSDNHPAPADTPDVHRIVYRDGAVTEYDRAAHRHTIDLTACGGTFHLKTGTSEIIVTPDSVTIRGDVVQINDDR